MDFLNFKIFVIFSILKEGLCTDPTDETFKQLEVSGMKQYSLIFLHGYNETGLNWQKTFNDLHLNKIEIVLPTAKIINVDGKNVSAWFDVKGTDKIREENKDKIARSMNIVDGSIRNQIKNRVKSTNIIIGGFDQGGSLALMMGLKFKRKLAGIIVLSAWLPHIYNQFINKEPLMIKNRDIPIFICHGTKDQVVPVKYGEEIATKVKNITSNISFKLYDDLEHNITPFEMNDVRNFILATLNITQSEEEEEESSSSDELYY